MSRLDPATYLQHIRDESQRFRDVLADCDPAADVPSCPEWTIAHLVEHLTSLLHWVRESAPRGVAAAGAVLVAARGERRQPLVRP